MAWNYQQFHVRYESLRNEMQVGSIYIRYFLDAGESFLRSLENPSHIVLFEKVGILYILLSLILPVIYPITHPLITSPPSYIMLFEKVGGCPLWLFTTF